MFEWGKYVWIFICIRVLYDDVKSVFYGCYDHEMHYLS